MMHPLVLLLSTKLGVSAVWRITPSACQASAPPLSCTPTSASTSVESHSDQKLKYVCIKSIFVRDSFIWRNSRHKIGPLIISIFIEHVAVATLISVLSLLCTRQQSVLFPSCPQPPVMYWLLWTVYSISVSEIFSVVSSDLPPSLTGLFLQHHSVIHCC